MSGGAFGYFYLQLQDLANDIYTKRSKEERKLAKLCRDLARVLKDLEWYRSGDTDLKDFKKSWKKFEKKWLKGGIK